MEIRELLVLIGSIITPLTFLLTFLFKPLYSRIKDNREWKSAMIAKIDGKKIETIESKNFIRIRGYQKDDNNQDTLECYLVEEFLKHILIRNNLSRYNRYLILGGSGVGKSTFSIALYYKYIKKYTKQNLPYSIFILNMGDEDNLESSIKAVKQKENPEKSILILDALDENTHVGKFFENFWKELNRLTIDFKFVIITSRTQLFTDQQQIPKNVGFRHDNKWIPYKKFYICPFTDRDVHHYLRNTFNEGSEEWKHACTIVSKCECDDLMSKAMLLTYIKSLVGLNTKSISIVDIYNEIIDYWLSRECEQYAAKGNPIHKEMKNRLYDLSKRLAVFMQDRDSYYITEEDYKSFLDENKNLLSDEFNGKTYAFDRRSLVEWENGKLKFSHRSFFEYFIALNIFENPSWSCNLPNLNLVEQFLNEMCKAYFTYHIESSTKSNKLNFGDIKIPRNDFYDIRDEQLYNILLDTEKEVGKNVDTVVTKAIYQRAIYRFLHLLVGKIVAVSNYCDNTYVPSLTENIRPSLKPIKYEINKFFEITFLVPFYQFVNLVQNTIVLDDAQYSPESVITIRKAFDNLLSKMSSVSENNCLFPISPKKTMPIFPNLFSFEERYIENLLGKVVPVIGFGLYDNKNVLYFIDKLIKYLNKQNYLPVFYVTKQVDNLNDIALFIKNLNEQIKQINNHRLSIIILVTINGVELPYVSNQTSNRDTLEKIQSYLRKMYEIANKKVSQ